MLKLILLLVSIGFFSLIHAQNAEKPESPYKAFFKQLDSLNDFEKSNYYLIKELKRTQNMESDDLLKFHEKIAINYIQCLKMDSAFLYLNEGLLIAEKLNNEKKMAQFYNVKGGAYYYLGQLDLAIVEYEKSIGLARKLNAKVQLASTLSNLGGIYIDLKKEEKAETLLNECVFLFDSLGLGNTSNNLIANRLLGTLYFNQGETEKSLAIFTRLVEISKEIQNVDTQISAQVYMARALIKLGKKEEARALYLELIELCKTINNLDTEATVMGHYADFLSQNGDYKAALEFHKKSWTIRKNIFDQQMASAVSDAEVKYKTEITKKEKALAQLQAVRKNAALIVSEKKQENQFWIIVALISILFFTFFTTFLFLHFRKLKVKQELEKERINAILTGQEKERERVAKDLHDGIVQDLTAIKHKLQLNIQSTPENKVFEGILEDISTAANEVRNISYQMMPLTLKEFGLKASIEALFERTKTIHQIEYECDFIGFEVRFSEQIEVTIYRICQELINNAVKHSKTNSLSALFKKNEQNIQINFEDNGIGFDENNSKNGIGLNSIKNRVEMVGGTIEKDYTHENSGTIFYIKLPL